MFKKILIILSIFLLSSSAWAQDKIVLGCSAAMSGHAGLMGQNLVPGMQAYFNHINSQGGINGKRIELVVLDDRYEPDKTVSNTRKFINEIKPLALIGYIGMPTTVKILDTIRKKHLPLIGPVTGAHQLHLPFNRYVFNIRNSYWAEAEVQVDYTINDLKKDKIAVFYQNDGFGISGYKGVKRALALKYNKSIVAEAVYQRDKLADDDAIKRICQSKPEVIIMVGTYDALADFVKRVRARGLTPVFICNSFTRATPLARLLDKLGNNVIFTQVAPPPTTWSGVDLPAIRLYRKLMRAYFPDKRFTCIGMEGFIIAEVIVEGLRRCGNNLTSENLVKVLETFRDYNPNINANLTYTPHSREGLDLVYLTEIKNSKPNFLIKIVRKSISMYIF
jgi:branched-chain amino acid transport system substrate-binding protein